MFNLFISLSLSVVACGACVFLCIFTPQQPEPFTFSPFVYLVPVVFCTRRARRAQNYRITLRSHP